VIWIVYIIYGGRESDVLTGTTPLHLMVRNRWDALALLLVAHGANINQSCKRGFSPYDEAQAFFQKELKGKSNSSSQSYSTIRNRFFALYNKK
jgi:ankyrin repeat protein